MKITNKTMKEELGKKYEFTDETKEIDGHVVYRIRALRDIPRNNNHGIIYKGDLGGFVENEDNLSQEGGCWVDDIAVVMGSAHVVGDAVVVDHAQVRGDVTITNNSAIRGFAYIDGSMYSSIEDDAVVTRHAVVKGKFCLRCNCRVSGDAVIDGSDVLLSGYVTLDDSAYVTGRVHMYGKIDARGKTRIVGPENRGDLLVLNRDADFARDVVITNEYDYISMYNQWSSTRLITYTRNNKMWLTGCFFGTRRQLIKKAFKDSFVKGLCFIHATAHMKAICRLRNLTVADPYTKAGRFKRWLFGEMR